MRRMASRRSSMVSRKITLCCMAFRRPIAARLVVSKVGRSCESDQIVAPDYLHDIQLSLVGADRLVFKIFGLLLPSFVGADRLVLFDLGLDFLSASQSCMKELEGKS